MTQKLTIAASKKIARSLLVNRASGFDILLPDEIDRELAEIGLGWVLKEGTYFCNSSQFIGELARDIRRMAVPLLIKPINDVDWPTEAEIFCFYWLADLMAAAGDCEGEASARERIQEDPVSIQVRSGWYTPGDSDVKPGEFEILLCTGWPAVRIMGDLDDHGQPTRAYMQYQDWNTPWTDYYERGAGADLLEYATHFFYDSWPYCASRKADVLKTYSDKHTTGD